MKRRITTSGSLDMLIHSLYGAITKTYYMDNQEFNYIIAMPWVEGKPHLASYAYGREVFFDDMEHAIEMCAFINGRCESEDKGKYKIYKIDSTPIN